MKIARILLSCFLAFGAIAANAQTQVTVCDGTDYSASAPFYGFANMDGEQTSQMIYPASALSALEGMIIKGMIFYPRDIVDWKTQNTWSMAEVEQAAFPSKAIMSVTSTEVSKAVGEYDKDAKTWTIVFDTPYTYAGGNLLLQGVMPKDYNGNKTFYGAKQTAVSSVVYFNNMGFGYETTGEKFLPKVTFICEESEVEVELGDVVLNEPFESYTDAFSTKAVGEWTYIDKDGWSTYANPNMTALPHAGEAQAYQLIDTSDSRYTAYYAAHGGKKFLMAMGAKDEDTLTSLANRVIRLNSQMTPKERTEFTSTVGTSAGNLAQNLLDAFDPDVISRKAGVDLSDDHEPTEEEQRRMDEVKKDLIKEAVQPFYNPDIRNFIEDVRRSHEQVIDSVNLDSVIFAGYDTDKQANADRIIKTFHDFIEENKDEILALRIVYDQRYKDRPMAITQLKALYEKLKAQNITIERLWDCYAIKKPEKVKRGTVAQLTDLISMIRFEMGYADNLSPFADRVNYNFMQWTLRRNAGNVHFTEEQMEWLRLIKDHIAVSLSIEPEDLDLSPFDRKGGLGRFYDVFGEQYEAVLMEMNIELVA